MTKTKQLAALVVAFGWLVAAPSLAATWQVDAAPSTLKFTNSYQNVQYTGQFKRFTAKIDYDPANLAHAKFDVSVDITSLDTRNAERDHAALGADFFDTAEFPKAHFVTNAFHKGADGKVVADGTLTLRGVSKPVELQVQFAPRGNAATLDVTARLMRLDFGIGTGQWADQSLIGDGVTVHGHLVLTRAASH
jgi:polyisoprenoid-binding protein YceI